MLPSPKCSQPKVEWKRLPMAPQDEVLMSSPNRRLIKISLWDDMEVPSESFHWSSWDSRTCYPRRAFVREDNFPRLFPRVPLVQRSLSSSSLCWWKMEEEIVEKVSKASHVQQSLLLCVSLEEIAREAVGKGFFSFILHGISAIAGAGEDSMGRRVHL